MVEWIQVMKDFESEVEEVRLVDHWELTLHFELNCHSLETYWRLSLGQLFGESG